MSNVKILVCCHKRDRFVNTHPYMPIQLGKALSNLELGIQGDNEGDNISSKNPLLCELTGLYWAWKNLKNIDVIGLCHYRRYFDFHKQKSKRNTIVSANTTDMDTFDFSIPEKDINKVISGSVITSPPMVFEFNLAIQYCLNHISDDFKTLERIIKEEGNKKYIDSFMYVFYKNKKFIPFNMFIMRFDLFEKYCNWLFPLLVKLENEIDVTHYTPYQRRALAFMGERLMNVFLFAETVNIEHRSVVQFFDDYKYSEVADNRPQRLFKSLLFWK